LPFFLSQEGHAEHASDFSENEGIVFYHARYPEQTKKYSERHVWITRSYDPYIHEIAIYHRTNKKWVFIQAFMASRNPIKSIMFSSLTRRYIQQCGSRQDNYRLILSISNDLGEKTDLRPDDFILDISHEEFADMKEHYQKEIKLLQLYAIQEYGMLTENDDIMWISDELNGSLFSSWEEFFSSVSQLVPVINSYIIDSAQKRGTFFPGDMDEYIDEYLEV